MGRGAKALRPYSIEVPDVLDCVEVRLLPFQGCQEPFPDISSDGRKHIECQGVDLDTWEKSLRNSVIPAKAGIQNLALG